MLSERVAQTNEKLLSESLRYCLSFVFYFLQFSLLIVRPRGGGRRVHRKTSTRPIYQIVKYIILYKTIVRFKPRPRLMFVFFRSGFDLATAGTPVRAFDSTNELVLERTIFDSRFGINRSRHHI